MKIENLENINFRGKLVKVGKFSEKPEKCFNKASKQLEQFVRSKDYNLFIQQDYSKNEMRIIADYPFPLKPNQRAPLFTRTQINIPTTSKTSKYVQTAKDVIDEFEYSLNQKEKQAWEQEQKKRKIENIKDVIETILLSPVFITEEIIRSINPKWANKFENLLQKIGI